MTTTAAPAKALSQVVAANVRAECARRGWAQKDLAERLGIARITVSDRHREKTPWTLDELQKLADLFGVEVGELVARPKGFEPLTFWLGADHSVTYWRAASWLGQEAAAFCDRCGWDVRGSSAWFAEAREHAEFACWGRDLI